MPRHGNAGPPHECDARSSESRDLFGPAAPRGGPGVPGPEEPLASRLRPRTFDEFVGQQHIVGPGALLRRAVEADRLSSVILYGPPGTGKTTLAGIVAGLTRSFFESVNAVSANVADLRKILERAEANARAHGRKTLLFIDELHRFNKAQQDVLMPHVERGNPVLVGATTHNPFFYIVAPLLSRSIVFELKALSKADIRTILDRALKDPERGLGQVPVEASEEALAFLAEVSDGDARRALNALEVGVLSTPKSPDGRVHFTLEAAQESIQKKAVVYDADEDAHYDTISAYIKSLRGSDPDAALYYLAKMLYAGEDPRFVARRLIIAAAEDVGNAEPRALLVATAALEAADFVGMPEARIPLAQATVFVACSPKSNAAYLGIEKAWKDVEEGRLLEVPDHLKNPLKGTDRIGEKAGTAHASPFEERGRGYKYAHDYAGHHVDQEYLSERRTYYEPTEQGFEKTFRDYLRSIRKAAGRPGPETGG